MDLAYADEPKGLDPQTEVLHELWGSATKHGVLSRAQTQSLHSKLYTNTWSREDFLLVGGRLWYYSPIKGRDGKTNHRFPSVKPESNVGAYSSGMMLSYFDLISADTASDREIAYMESSSPGCTVFVIHIKNPQSFQAEPIREGSLLAGPLKIHLKAESHNEALSWVAAILDESRPQKFDDNLLLLQAELTITNEQTQHSRNDVKTLLSFSTFEDTLRNHYLRSKFRAFLEESYCQETLLFWERAEDYHRGCPNTAADAAFSFKGAEGSPTLLEQRDWAQSIFDRFLAVDSPLQIVDCSAEDRDSIASLLATEPHFPLPPDLFSSLAATAYRRLKFSEGFFPSFVRHPQFRRWLAKSLHAENRQNAGFTPLSTCIDDDRLNTTQRGLIVSAVDEIPRASISGALMALVLTVAERGEKGDQESASVGELTRNTDWRLPEAQKNLSVTHSLPDWWWEEVMPFIMAESKPDSAQAMEHTVDADMHKLIETSMKLRDHSILDLMALGGERECTDILARRPPSLASPMSNLHSSLNYIPCSVRGSHGTIHWLGTFLIRFAADYGPLSKWKHVCGVITCFRSLGRLLLYELTGEFIGRIRLEHITGIHSVSNPIHGFHLYEDEGDEQVLRWEIATDEASEKQSYCTSQRFLQAVLVHTPERCTSTSIVHAGFMEKAVTGQVSVFRRRWCVVLSSGHLAYYRQEDFFSKYRGEIDLRGGKIRIFASSGPKHFGIDTADGRKLRFRALDNEERNAWAKVLGSVIALTSGTIDYQINYNDCQ